MAYRLSNSESPPTAAYAGVFGVVTLPNFFFVFFNLLIRQKEVPLKKMLPKCFQEFSIKIHRTLVKYPLGKIGSL